ncbi:MAG: hypothetical protein IJE43_15650 [Alphaproteobacteria bacterium]|nr:hypothetical protein [Alphaproteobacteria bacterium]
MTDTLVQNTFASSIKLKDLCLAIVILKNSGSSTRQRVNQKEFIIETCKQLGLSAREYIKNFLKEVSMGRTDWLNLTLANIYS